MKKIILTIIILMANMVMFAQCKEDETISTNPNNPINTDANLPIAFPKFETLEKLLPQTRQNTRKN